MINQIYIFLNIWFSNTIVYYVCKQENFLNNGLLGVYGKIKISCWESFFIFSVASYILEAIAC